MIKDYKKEIEKAIRNYNRYRNEAKENFEKIINGSKFGERDSWDFASYFPHELVEIIDKEDFIIKTRYKERGVYTEVINDAGYYIIIDDEFI